MIVRGGVVLALLLSGAIGAAASDVISVPLARVTSMEVAGKTWSLLSGRVEAKTDLSVARLVAVITDWAAYPRLFPKIKTAEFSADAEAVLLTETTVVSVFGFSVKNRFTLRITVEGKAPGPVSILWRQYRTDGTIDRLEGGWELEPALEAGEPRTVIRYRTVSAVPQNLPGQDALVGMFFPGELKQIVSSVLTEARQQKENP